MAQKSNRSRRKNTGSVNRAVKYPIFPTEKQAELFAKTFGCCRFIWNHMLADEQEFYAATDIHFIPTPAKYKSEFLFLKEVDSLALANAQLNLKESFSRFFVKTGGYPQYKSKKKSKNSYTTNNQDGTVSVSDGYIRLPKVGLVKAKLFQSVPDTWIIKNATVSKSPSGKYYCSINYQVSRERPGIELCNADNALGLDYSSPHFFVDSEGITADHNKYYRHAEKKLAREQRRLSRCKHGSKNREKARKQVALCHEKVANQRRDFCHQLSRKIANSYDAVCIEDLDLQNIAQTLHLGKSTNDNGFGMFRNFLEYKLEEQGKPLIVIDKWFASSKTCHECGHVNSSLTLKERTWICPCCGKHIERDYNAALNIRDEGIRQYMAETAA